MATSIKQVALCGDYEGRNDRELSGILEGKSDLYKPVKGRFPLAA